MARELKVLLWCDFCAEDEEFTEGEAITAAVGGTKFKELVACERHTKEFVAPFVEAFERLAIENPEAKLAKAPRAQQRPPSAATPGARAQREDQPYDPVVCLLCRDVFGISEEKATKKNPNALATHKRQSHKVPATEYRAIEYGFGHVVSSDPETLQVEVAVDDYPPLSDKRWKVPDYLHCPSPGCDAVFDPRIKSEQSAYQSMAGHKMKAHPGEFY